MKLLTKLSKIEKVGTFILVISVVLFFVILSFTQRLKTLNKLLHESCPLDPEICPFLGIPNQTIYGFAIVVILAGTGIYLLLLDRRKTKLKKSELEKMRKAAEELEGDELKVYETIMFSDGVIFQSELVEKVKFSKVKVSRLLDKLEAKGLVERKRRGLSNVVVLRYK